jgi:hypothetical protein
MARAWTTGTGAQPMFASRPEPKFRKWREAEAILGNWVNGMEQTLTANRGRGLLLRIHDRPRQA